MIIERLFTPGLAQVSYFVGDEDTGVAAVIDPRRDVDAYLQWTESRGLRIVAILETHVHADFVSGALELEARTGAPIYASGLGEQDFPHQPLNNGDEVEVGALRLRALWTPGHTPEHLAYLLFEGDASEPAALFSGDSLFVGEVGRPDLLGDEATERLSNHLFETVTQRLATLPDALKVYPGHTGGSACGKQIGDAPDTTIGAEKMGNYAFQKKDRQGFIAAVMNGMPKPPTYYPVLKKINKRGAVPIEELVEPTAMSTDAVKAAVDAGALVLDVRDPDAYGKGHIANALFAGYGPNFHTWMGWLAPYDRDMVLVTGDNAAVDNVLTALRQIGLDRVIGYLNGGMPAWAGKIETLAQMSPEELNRQREQDLVVVDVRADSEWNEDHISGAEHVFLGDITQGKTLPDTVENDQPVAIICGSGYRSTVAASILNMRGYTNLRSVVGGMSAWKDARLPVTSG
jgi:hydroxyacylglutathione hydrolase